MPALHAQRDQGAAQALREAIELGKPLGGLDLRGVSLVDEDLHEVDLSGVDLSGADLSRCNLAGAQLFRAKLVGATLFETDLEKAELTAADLTGANLNGARAPMVGLGKAILRDASLFEADLTGSSLIDVDATGADFRMARLDCANAAGIDLSSAQISRASLEGTDLTGATFTGASADGVLLSGARLMGLRGFERASWIGVDLRNIDFAGAHRFRRFVLDQNYLQEFREQSRATEYIYRLWWITSDCGRSLTRWGLLTAVIAIVFAFAYTWVDIDFGDHETRLSPLYFSVVTLTTLGYGDVLPASVAAQVVTMMQVVIGYLMLGGILSIFSNKMARRAE